ncbi:long-chain acyl-CoA synthetase [Leucobacter komagatae]|uniref:Long-chain acyl-CoA synthetase n=2 Tax=Leucobacter komagatae TaxID=55969 RepID=A0A542Y4R4_9MICO|nr:AMP-binding protein [Leucobacter komagatae]TQL43067.1 long-chain acyl-CoA synthetase [Leucobacter komagatae]
MNTHDARPSPSPSGSPKPSGSPNVPRPTTLTAAWRTRVESTPDAPCITYFDTTLSVTATDRLSKSLAAGLLDRGVGPGGRVAVWLQNIPHFAISMLAIWHVGGIVVPLNPMYRERELHTVLKSSGAVGLICTPELVEVAGAAATGTALSWALAADDTEFQSENDPRVFPPRQGGEADLATADLPFALAELSEVFAANTGRFPDPTERRPDDIAMLSYTSGTTGPPKGAQATHSSLLFVALNFIEWAELDARDRMLALAPLFHITGSVIIGLGTLLSQACLVFLNRPRPDVALEAFSRHKITVTVAPITMYTALYELPNARAADFATVRELFTGGAPVPPAKVAAFEQRFGKYILNAYGLTESNAGIIGVPRGERAPVHEPTGTLSIGRAMPGVSLRVLDEAGNEVPAGAAGELELSGDFLASGYWRDPAATETAFPAGRLLTGDVAIIDDEGWVFLVDRIKDQINTSGYKVWPREVEDVIYEHPAVREVAVVGEPDDYRGEAVLAYVSLREGQRVSSQELVSFARERLAAYKTQRRIVFIDELPKTLTGKIKRRDLRRKVRG